MPQLLGWLLLGGLAAWLALDGLVAASLGREQTFSHMVWLWGKDSPARRGGLLLGTLAGVAFLYRHFFGWVPPW